MPGRLIRCPYPCPHKTDKTGDEVIEFGAEKAGDYATYKCRVYDGRYNTRCAVTELLAWLLSADNNLSYIRARV